MIEKDEILEMARSLNLQPDTVEKDYVLGWMLYGLNNHPQTRDWAFKGGTSLKKCFFETFRFSEDLDYTLSNNLLLETEVLKRIFQEIVDIIHDQTGIEFFKDKFKFKVIPKENGKISAQGKIHYNGPLRRKMGMMTIKLDLTTDEILVLAPVSQRVHHPYTDEPKEGIFATCYAFEEVIAEKVRALAQRARPRDLYDVVHFFRNRNLISNPQLVFNTLEKKCSYKSIDTPTYQHIEKHEKLEELEPQWAHMLDHQLPNLPPMNTFWEDLEPFFDWLYGQLETEKIVGVTENDEEVFQPGRIANAYSVDSMLHKIQFAAASRVCISLKYKNKNRTIEPLSFRKARNGNRLLYGFERESKQVKGFSLSAIQQVEITNLSYVESRYPVEISPSGAISMPPIRRNVNRRLSGDSSFKNKTIVRINNSPKHRYECPYCKKKFSRAKISSILGKHKDKNGFICHGRHGIYLGYS